MKQQDLAVLDAAKERFIDEWEKGERPTLDRYVALYPKFARELSEFIIGYASLSAFDPEDIEQEQFDEAQVQSAIQRGVEAGFSNARSLNERLTEIGCTHDQFYELIDVTQDFIAAFQRQPVTNVPISFWHVAALALNDTLSRVQQFLSPKRLAFRSGQAPQATPVEFSSLLSRVHAANGLSDSQFEHWLREANRNE